MALSRDEWDAKELLEEAIKVQLPLARAADDPVSHRSRQRVGAAQLPFQKLKV